MNVASTMPYFFAAVRRQIKRQYREERNAHARYNDVHRVEKRFPPHGDVERNVQIRFVAARVDFFVPVINVRLLFIRMVNGSRRVFCVRRPQFCTRLSVRRQKNERSRFRTIRTPNPGPFSPGAIYSKRRGVEAVLFPTMDRAEFTHIRIIPIRRFRFVNAKSDRLIFIRETGRFK